MNKLMAARIHFIALIVLLTVPAIGFTKSISEIAKKSSDAVVLIITLGKQQKPLGYGSGFFVKSDGVLVTNYHVIQGASYIWVRLSNGGLFRVKDILGMDRKGDIAVLKVHGKKLPTIKMGDSDKVKIGDTVVAIGNPLAVEIGLEMEIENTTTDGIVSAKRIHKKHGREILQISVPISPGSSGGVLLSMEGEAIGMTTASVMEGQNLNFAIPINQIRNAMLRGRETTGPAESAESFYLKGVLASDKRDFDAAEHFYKKALEKDPKHVESHISLGLIYYERMLYDLQLKHFKEAVRIDPDNLYAHYYVATAYEDKGLFDKAIKEYQEVLRIDPKDKDALYSLGILYLVERKREKAWRAYTSLREYNPGLALKLKKLLDALK